MRIAITIVTLFSLLTAAGLASSEADKEPTLYTAYNIWRASKMKCINFKQGSDIIPAGTMNSGSFTDTPTEAGTYYYGIHAVDTSQNWADEGGPVRVTVNAVAGGGVLRVHPTNPRYFTDGTGKAIYLTGSHTWSNLIDEDDNSPPDQWFSYNNYLDFMENRNHNFIRMWSLELFKYQFDSGAYRYAEPNIWQRTGPGSARDGNPKFDLTRFNQAYFDRMRSRVIAARDRGIYVSIMLFEGYSVQFATVPSCWDGHPFNINNNINEINGNPNGDSRGLEIHTLQVPAVTDIQKAYIRKVIETVNDLDNVLYEIGNEIYPGSTDWQYEMINYIKSYEAAKPKQHPVGMTFQHMGGSNSALFNSPADWISPTDLSGSGDDYRTNPPIATGDKIIVSDTDHLWGIGGTQAWVWKSFTRGMNPIYMDPWGDFNNPFDPDGDEIIRKSMGYTLAYAKKMELADMPPSDSTSDCSTQYCLRNPGNEYLVYQPSSGSFTVNLSAGTYDYEWFNPDTGAVVDTGTITVSAGSRNFTPPFTGNAVLYLSLSAP